MYTIVYALKKHNTLRIFLTVALALAMAWAVGSGIHLNSNSSSSESAPASVTPANTTATDSNTRLNPAAYNAPDSGNSVTALDAALKNMSSIQRDRNSANTDTTTNTTSTQSGFAQTNNAVQTGTNVGANK